jgi:RimJ/RimL family protein N-acetyltransferase
MAKRTNEFSQPVGEKLADWRGAIRPTRTPMTGSFCSIEPLNTALHLQELFDAYSDDAEGRMWTYMPGGPFKSLTELQDWMDAACKTDDPLFFAILDLATGRAVGVAAYMRIKPTVGVIEVGNIAFSPRLQKTRAATEAMYLMAERAFSELGYRRYEWKCDALNAASCRAAERLGFVNDGLFEQAVVYKGRNRDTAWYSMLDRDWPAIKSAYEKWLSPENFDDTGRQKQKLQQFITLERG